MALEHLDGTTLISVRNLNRVLYCGCQQIKCAALLGRKHMSAIRLFMSFQLQLDCDASQLAKLYKKIQLRVIASESATERPALYPSVSECFVNHRTDVVRTFLCSVVLFLTLAVPATAGPPYVSDDPEPTEDKHFEIYVFTGELIRVREPTVLQGSISIMMRRFDLQLDGR